MNCTGFFHNGSVVTVFFKVRDKRCAEFHVVQAELHTARLFVVHRRAQLIIRNKFVVCGAEGIKHVAVIRGDFPDQHKFTDDNAYQKADLQIQWAKEQNDTADDQAQKPHHNSGSDGVPSCTGSNQVFLCFLNLPDQRKSCLKVKDKLPTEQIVSDPADKKKNCRPYNLHCHEKNASVFKGGLYLITT